MQQKFPLLNVKKLREAAPVLHKAHCPVASQPLERLPRSQIFLDTAAKPVLQECEIRSSVLDGELCFAGVEAKLALYPIPRR